MVARQTPFKVSRIFALLAISFFSAFFAYSSTQRSFHRSIHWSVILCRMSGAPALMRGPEFYRDLVLRTGAGGLADFWADTSYSQLSFEGSVVKGWYTQNRTLAQAQKRSRRQRFEDCLDAARSSPTDPYIPPIENRVAVVTYPDLDLFGLPGKGAFLPASADLGAWAHEIGHGLGLRHSFSDDDGYRNSDWAQPGEYDDPWDLMSYGNVFSVKTPRFGEAAPGLNAHQRDQMGWIPHDRILTVGAAGETSFDIEIAPLSAPGSRGYLMVKVPLDSADPLHYYTVEYRRKAGWDGGIRSDTVLIHEVARGRSRLLRSHMGNRDPIQILKAYGITISTRELAADHAVVRVSRELSARSLRK